ncbi:AAA family ATPase [Oribacterium sp. FC2011]|uniref:AAA family ATPase n=1 Tax=Oribacterium sp. FC2011 TaxID=1408311 RepID=UPI000678E978|nr:AAA family ATPase [Oribacterium sp. FC2011]
MCVEADHVNVFLTEGSEKKAMTKIDVVWLAAAVLTYNVCQENVNWQLEDVYFQQQNIVRAAKAIMGEEIPNALVNQHAVANSGSLNRNCAYLVEVKDKKRRLSFFGEFTDQKEHPNMNEMKDNIIVETKTGNISIQQLFNFVKDVYTPRMKELADGKVIVVKEKDKPKMTDKRKYDKNLILYGPPGTGKTYNSVNYAVAICEGKTFEEVQQESYDDVLLRFEALKKSGRIAFTTFHQSYGYEEFIEGIKPVTDDETGSISYEITNGIFKDFCEKAELPQDIKVNHDAQVYVVRLKGNGNNDLKKECFRDGEIRFDWAEDYTGGWMKWFSAMKPGDYVLSYYGQSKNIDGVGIVQDEEPLYDESKGSYKWTRKVEWLVTGRIIDVLDANNGKYLSNFHVGRVPDMKLSSLLALIGGSGDDPDVTFEKAWKKLAKAAEDNRNKYTFTRRSGSTIEAAFNGSDSFKVEWSGGTSNILKKKDVYEQWTNTELSIDSIPNGGTKWLIYARQAILDELTKLGLTEYKGNASKGSDACVFIIDEINRGNISKIFGELITLIEDTKRKGCPEEMTAKLPYSHTEFSVPKNVYILGTMNTADRSIALMDTALRRRFSFIEMMPNSDVLDALGVGTITDGDKELNVSNMLNVINRRIEFLYDREHTIGHAFFTKLKDDPSVKTLAMIFKKNVIPLLQEYFYEDYAKIQYVLGDNQKEASLKFILDEGLDVRDIFNGVPDIDLPEKKYRIQESAFYKLSSYKGIGKGL